MAYIGIIFFKKVVLLDSTLRLKYQTLYLPMSLGPKMYYIVFLHGESEFEGFRVGGAIPDPPTPQGTHFWKKWVFEGFLGFFSQYFGFLSGKCLRYEFRLKKEVIEDDVFYNFLF